MKLVHEVDTLKLFQDDAYVAINAIREAYHLREWVWHDKIENNTNLQTVIVGQACDEHAFNNFINDSFSRFPLLQELCNGSKHFERPADDKIVTTHESNWDKLPWGGAGLYIELDDDNVVSISNLVSDACKFWQKFFATHGL